MNSIFGLIGKVVKILILSGILCKSVIDELKTYAIAVTVSINQNSMNQQNEGQTRGMRI